MNKSDIKDKILFETSEFLQARISVLEDIIQVLGVPYALLVHKYDQELALIKDRQNGVRNSLFGGDDEN